MQPATCAPPGAVVWRNQNGIALPGPAQSWLGLQDSGGLITYASISPHSGLCSPHLPRFPGSLGGHRGVSLGWAVLESASVRPMCFPSVLGLCVAIVCPPRLAGRTGDTAGPWQSWVHQAPPLHHPSAGPAALGAHHGESGPRGESSPLCLPLQHLEGSGTRWVPSRWKS